MNITNFTPTDDTVSIAATTATSSFPLAASVTPTQVLVLNTHSAVIHIAFGDETVTASTNDTPIPANGWITLNAQNYTHVAAIAASGSGTIYFTPGVGT